MTLLFTDIEGSTRLLQAVGAGYGAVLAAHRKIIADSLATESPLDQAVAMALRERGRPSGH